MYHRWAMFLSATSGADAQHEGHDVADHQIRDREEDAGEPHHHEDHDRGDHDLLAGRPRDLLGLGADLPEELLRTDHRDLALHLRDARRTPRQPGRASRSRPTYIRLISGKAPRRA